MMYVLNWSLCVCEVLQEGDSMRTLTETHSKFLHAIASIRSKHRSVASVVLKNIDNDDKVCMTYKQYELFHTHTGTH